LSKSAQPKQQQEAPQEVLDGTCKVIHGAWNELTRAWTLPVIHTLGLQKSAGFNELKRWIDGISASSLAERLKELEKEGVMERKVYSEPLRVKYSLTQKGIELKSVLKYFANWAVKWAERSGESEEAPVQINKA
jgi:DNA-binding HxlR family transcriptional regulator